jgi:dTDP-4-dehydrorhamnose reductase
VKVLIAGANGQLALALVRRLKRHSASIAHEVVALSRDALDVTSMDRCRDAVTKFAPNIVINCAAYTAVDKAEAERATAFAVNAQGAENLAVACNEVNAMLIHFSTDYVFDGTATQPYVETDRTAPLGVYGESKLAGEMAVAAQAKCHAILRLSWVYSNDGANFYKTMLRLAAERPLLRVVADQFGVPNYTGDIADAVAAMLNREFADLEAKSGLYHLSSVGICSWHEFAQAIIERAPLIAKPTVEAIATTEFPTPAKRPAYSALDSSRFAATFQWQADNWRNGLDRCLAERAMSA